MARVSTKKKTGITIKTSVLQKMVGKAVKGASENKLLPITQMMCIRLRSGELSIITTDFTNYLYIRQDKIEGEDFYVVVPVDKFSKLVSKTTSDNIALQIVDGSLQVTGNGKYLVPIQYDEDGSMVEYPDPLEDVELDSDSSTEIQLSTISKILSIIKPALAVTLENPCYTGYYVGDNVIATNSFLINMLKVKLFEEPRLVSAHVMNLLSVMTTEKISVDFGEGIVIYSTPDCVVYSHDLEGIEEYAVDDIMAFNDVEFPSMCKLSKNTLLQLLDRLSLFVTDYEDGGVHLTFTSTGMQVSSASSSGIETIPYIESEGFEEFFGSVDIDMFIKQVKAQSGDVVTLCYGADSSIKLVEDNVIQIIALLDDESAEDDIDSE